MGRSDLLAGVCVGLGAGLAGSSSSSELDEESLDDPESDSSTSAALASVV